MLADRDWVELRLKLEDDRQLTQDINNETRTICRYPVQIFCRSLVICLLISVVGSLFLGLQYAQPLIAMSSVRLSREQRSRNQYSTKDNTIRNIALAALAIFTLYVMIKLYLYFLELYTTFLFNMNVVKQYKIETAIKYSGITSFCCSCWAQTIIFGVWMTLFMLDAYNWMNDHVTDTNYDEDLTDFVNDKLAEITSIKSPIYWAVGLLLSPVFILCVSFIVITFVVHRKVNIYISRSMQSDYNHEPLVVNNHNIDAALLDHIGAANFNIDKKYLYRILMVHILLLFTWIIWKWLTTPFISTQINTNNGLSLIQTVEFERDNIYLSYWSLFIFTTIIKQICNKLIDASSDSENLLFNSKRMKIMINILISILFSFGLKFVFTNIKDWKSFILISVINFILNVVINGSFQSHQYGKKCINKCRACLLLKRNDINNMDKVLKYNKDLALDLSIKFIISGTSSLMMMMYFFMGTVNANVNNKVFEFLAASFGFSCIVYFGQIIAFKKRDRKYFISALEENIINPKYYDMKSLWEIYKYWSEDKKAPKDNWIAFLSVCLVLAWYWIGSLTGMPADFN